MWYQSEEKYCSIIYNVDIYNRNKDCISNKKNICF